MTKLEKACEAITNYVQKYHGEDDLVKSWQEVIDLVRLSYPDIDPKGSNMHPSDICYNRANAMHKTKRFDKWPHAFPDQNWSPQGSGIQIREKYVPLIKRLWDTFEKSDLTGLSARQ